MTITAAAAACEGVGMTGEAFLRGALASVEVNDSFSEAVIAMGDGSRLCFWGSFSTGPEHIGWICTGCSKYRG